MGEISRRDALILVVSAGLVLPLVFSWMNFLAPELALLGIIILASLAIWRAGLSLKRARTAELNDQRTTVLGSGPIQTEERRMNGQQERLGIAGAALPPERPHGGPFAIWKNLWESKNHKLMILLAALWIVCPLDGDFLIGIGWIDDGFAAALLIKHLCGLFCGEVAVAHAAVSNALQRTQIVRTEVTDRATSDAEVVAAGSHKRRG